MKIKEFVFEKKTFLSENFKLAKFSQGENWPVVYILENGRHIYIGQSNKFKQRMIQHIDYGGKSYLKKVHCIYDSDYNKSAILDIESSLISLFDGDKKFNLLNANNGSLNQDYYNKKYYKEKVPEIWNKLKDKGLADKEIFEIENSDLFKYSPYKSLSNDQFSIANMILRDCIKEVKSISIVEGNPGTGKTILAVYLLKMLVMAKQREGKKVALIVPMASLRSTIKKVCSQSKGLMAKYVIGPYDINRDPDTGECLDENVYDTVIVDETHRLIKYGPMVNRGGFQDKSNQLGFYYKENNQLDWINAYSNHQIYFYDNGQSIHPADIESSTLDKMLFDNQDICTKYELVTQHRTKGGNDYIKWVDRLLRNEKCVKHPPFGDYIVKLFETFTEFTEKYDEIKDKDELNRMVSGYSFPWLSKKGIQDYDIELEGIKKPWNSDVKNWIHSNNAINEVGCIHKVQGYDLNYVFLIFGYEIDYVNGHIVIDREKYFDIKGKETTSDIELKEYIINIYNTLMTRGIDGIYIYVCNPGLRKYIKKNIGVDKNE